RAVAAIRRVAEAELADIVPAPALHPAVVEQRAGTELTGADADRGTTRPEVHRRQGVTHLPRPVTPDHLVTEPQASAHTGSPTLDRPVVEQRAGVHEAGRDSQRGAARPEVHRRQRVT